MVLSPSNNSTDIGSRPPPRYPAGYSNQRGMFDIATRSRKRCPRNCTEVIQGSTAARMIAASWALLTLWKMVLMAASSAEDIQPLISLLIMVIFSTGFMASRPWNPVSYNATMLIHVGAGDLALLLIPFTKLAHIVLFPVLRLSGELGWKFPARAGEQVGLTIDGKEVRPI